MREIKNCPFCGGRGVLREQNEIAGHGMTTIVYYVKCDTCGARGKDIDTYLDGFRDVENKVIDAWNSRV